MRGAPDLNRLPINRIEARITVESQAVRRPSPAVWIPTALGRLRRASPVGERGIFLFARAARHVIFHERNRSQFHRGGFIVDRIVARPAARNSVEGGERSDQPADERKLRILSELGYSEGRPTIGSR